MILLMNNDPLNKTAAKWLVKDKESIQSYFLCRFDNINDDTLTLIDLTANGNFQEMYDGELFADKLVKRGMPASITTINLILSVFSDKDDVGIFAQKLIYKLKKEYGIIVKVHVAADIDYNNFLLVPPISDDKWRVYTITNANIARIKPYDFDKLYQMPEKQLLWEGSDIYTWLIQPDQTLESLDELLEKLLNIPDEEANISQRFK